MEPMPLSHVVMFRCESYYMLANTGQDYLDKHSATASPSQHYTHTHTHTAAFTLNTSYEVNYSHN